MRSCLPTGTNSEWVFHMFFFSYASTREWGLNLFGELFRWNKCQTFEFYQFQCVSLAFQHTSTLQSITTKIYEQIYSEFDAASFTWRSRLDWVSPNLRMEITYVFFMFCCVLIGSNCGAVCAFEFATFIFLCPELVRTIWTLFWLICTSKLSTLGFRLWASRCRLLHFGLSQWS